MNLEQLLAELKKLLAAAEGEGRQLTEDEVVAAEDLERQIDVYKRSQLVGARFAALNATDTSMLRGLGGGGVRTAADSVGAGLYGTEASEPSEADKKTLRRAFDVYFRTGHAVEEMVHYRAQGTAPDSAGGYLVPEEFRQKLTERTVAFGGIAENAEGITTSTGAKMPWPTLDDTENEGQVVAEHAAPTGGADLEFGEKELDSFTYTAPGAGANPLRVSVELAQDSAFDIQALVQRRLGMRIARTQAKHWVNGTGTGQPEGITASTGPSSVTTAGGITYAKLVAAKHTIDPSYREQNCKWYFNDQTFAALEALVDTTGRPLLMPAAQASASGDAGQTLLNYPIVIDQAFADFEDATGAIWGVFGDMREAYVIRRVREMQLIVNPYSRANNREIEYTVWERASGLVQNEFAVSLLKNTPAP